MADVDINGIKVLNTGEQYVVNKVYDSNTLSWIPQVATVGGGPVGDVNVTNANIAVTGTFFQATQPVSIGATVTVADNHTLASGPLSVRLSDGTNFYNATGGGGSGGDITTAVKGTTASGSPTSENTNANVQSLHTSITNASIPVTQSGLWNVSVDGMAVGGNLSTAGKGSTVTGSPTSENTSADIQSLHTKITNASLAVTGAFYQATQPVSLASAPTTPVTGTFWQATQPVSIASTITVSDNHTTAGAPLSVRLTDGSAFYTASGGAGGTLSTAVKGATASGSPTSENTSADIQALHTKLVNSSLAVTGSFYQATQPVSIATAPVLVAGSAVIGKVGIDQTTPGTTNKVSIGTDGTVALNTALPTGTNTIGSVKLTDGTNTATIGNLTNSKPVATMIVDGNGDQIASFGGGTQYTQGATQASPVGTVAMGKNPSNAINAISLDASGYLNVNVAAGGGASTLATSAKGATSAGNPTSENTSADIQALHTRITNTSMPVTGTFWQATQPVSLASAPTTPVTGTFWQATQPVSIATAPVLVAGSAVIGQVSINQTTVGTTNAVSLKHINTTAIVTGGVNGTIGVGGITAAAATSTGNPVRIGAIGRTANPAAVTDGQVSNIMTDKMGRQVVVQGHIRDLVGRQSTTITSSTTATTIITAGSAGVFNDITSLTVTNGSATATIVTLGDGTFTAVYNVPGGGGFTIPFNPPLPATTANTAWTLTCGTSVASIYVSAVYVKNL